MTSMEIRQKYCKSLWSNKTPWYTKRKWKKIGCIMVIAVLVVLYPAAGLRACRDVWDRWLFGNWE